jgi:hypothetical protein
MVEVGETASESEVFAGTIEVPLYTVVLRRLTERPQERKRLDRVAGGATPSTIIPTVTLPGMYHSVYLPSVFWAGEAVGDTQWLFVWRGAAIARPRGGGRGMIRGEGGGRTCI